MNKKKIIVLIIGIVLIILLIVLMNKNSSNKKLKYNPTNVMNSEAIKKELQSALKICEDEYQETLEVTEGYDRSAFYNETRIGLKYFEGTVKFVNSSDINVNSESEFINREGNKTNEKTKTTYRGEEVQISDYYNLEEGKYYLIKYQKNNEEYSYCFVGKLGSNGFEDLDLYCVIKENLREDINQMDLLNDYNDFSNDDFLNNET